ncbi:MAG: heparinase II/III family protein [Planctomycetia bacterium]|nr:heparinase II/III family protein [Planctomycetia bacterium]
MLQSIPLRILMMVVAAIAVGTSPACQGGPARDETPSQEVITAGKTASVMFPPELTARARQNARQHPWAKQACERIVAAAGPWLKLSDDELWELMFSNSIKRSWMVWSNGHCPACQKPVPMYEWVPAALERPWKMQCPQCRELFPKNDFGKFYRSGLNEQGVFEPARADRSLLFNIDHPDPADPLHRFGVDDGEGYVDGQKRWRFIGAYLIYGQWKQAIVGGIRNLAAAYLVTGEPVYAHKAGVLLDRVADFYPTFDFGKEGVMYEGPPSAGYVSTWHDACVEVYDLATAYDVVFEAIARDASLVAFLADKARAHKLANPKTSFPEIRRNIEERILRDTLANRHKIESNYPTTDVTIAVIRTVLDWPNNRDEVTAILDGVIQRATAVDGVSGEKGMAGYSTIAPRTVAELLGRYERMEPGFLAAAIRRQPKLHALYRFHLDTWCLGQYYPCIGDTTSFAQKVPHYPALTLSQAAGLDPSGFTFLWNLSLATGDKDFVRVLYAANGGKVDGLPYDLFADDPAEFQQRVAKMIAEEGTAIQQGSVNKSQWCLAILRAGEGSEARAAWLDYDSGGTHGHANGLNLGLFAKGLDLLPDFGYPPVQFGGWGAPRAVWYTRTAAHNTVVVDGQNTRGGSGAATAWIDGQTFRAVRASAAALVGGQQYERTAVLVDVSQQDSYLIDLFRVVGGREHAKFMHGHFGRITPQGLTLQPAEETGWGEQMRSWRKDAHPPAVWSVDWSIEDYLKYLPAGRDLHVRYTDLTPGTEVLTLEGWVAVGLYGGTAEAWIPRVLVRRRANEAPLASTFVSVIEPYEKQPLVTQIRRLELEMDGGRPCPDSDVALEIRLADGGRDVLVAIDAENPRGPARPAGAAVMQKESGIRLVGQFGFARFDAAGKPRRVVLGLGTLLEAGSLRVQRKTDAGWTEVDPQNLSTPIVSGSAEEVEAIVDGVQKIWPK